MAILKVSKRNKLAKGDKAKLSPASKEKIDIKANKVLGHKTLRGVRK